MPLSPKAGAEMRNTMRLRRALRRMAILSEVMLSALRAPEDVNYAANLRGVASRAHAARALEPGAAVAAGWARPARCAARGPLAAAPDRRPAAAERPGAGVDYSAVPVRRAVAHREIAGVRRICRGRPGCRARPAGRARTLARLAYRAGAGRVPVRSGLHAEPARRTWLT